MVAVPEGPRRGRRRGELTIATVARLAGVSVPTVSKVINGRTGVAQDTRRRVEEILHQHGYRRPEAVPPAPVLEIVFEAIESHIAVEIMRGVEHVTRQYELAAAFTEVAGRDWKGRPWVEPVLQRRPIGVIAVYFTFTPSQQAQLAASTIPIVALDPMGEPAHSTPSVGATNWSGGVTATRHLLELGHRRIAMIGGPAGFLCARARLDGFRATLDAAGVAVDPELIRCGEFRFEDGFAHAMRLLRLPDRPSAIFASNDLQALGVYEAARQLGLSVPRDLSVVGFDDLKFTEWAGPPLTTVRQPFADMGSEAARMVLALAAGETLAHNRLELATSLVVRQSTARPAGA